MPRLLTASHRLRKRASEIVNCSGDCSYEMLSLGRLDDSHWGIPQHDSRGSWSLRLPIGSPVAIV